MRDYFYVFPWALLERIPRSHGTADLYHCAQLIVNYVFTVLKRIPQLPSNAYYVFTEKGHHGCQQHSVT